MKNIFLTVLLATLATFMGCANVNPRNNSPIKNSNGQIEDIRNNQNGIMAEVGKLRQENGLMNSKLEDVQQGLMNLNASISKNDNSGVQILQGDGALIMVFSLAVIGMLLFWYRDRAIKSEKAAEVMALEITKINDPMLNDSILRTAMNKKCERHVYKILNKNFQSQS